MSQHKDIKQKYRIFKTNSKKFPKLDIIDAIKVAEEYI